MEMENQKLPERRKIPKVKFLDRLHHGAVYVCWAVSAICLVGLISMGTHYYGTIRPQLKLQLLKKEQELLREGASFSEDDSSEELQ